MLRGQGLGVSELEFRVGVGGLGVRGQESVRRSQGLGVSELEFRVGVGEWSQ